MTLTFTDENRSFEEERRSNGAIEEWRALQRRSEDSGICDDEPSASDLSAVRDDEERLSLNAPFSVKAKIAEFATT